MVPLFLYLLYSETSSVLSDLGNTLFSGVVESISLKKKCTYIVFSGDRANAHGLLRNIAHSYIAVGGPVLIPIINFIVV
jgi:hypothetical protein